MAAVPIMWLYLFNPSIGLFKRILNAPGRKSILWLNAPHVSPNSLLIPSVWKNMGLNMLIFLSALQSVPRELYEASSLDGAGNRKHGTCSVPGESCHGEFPGAFCGYEFQQVSGKYADCHSVFHVQCPVQLHGRIIRLSQNSAFGDRNFCL